jgi:hypothetical protein
MCFGSFEDVLPARPCIIFPRSNDDEFRGITFSHCVAFIAVLEEKEEEEDSIF